MVAAKVSPASRIEDVRRDHRFDLGGERRETANTVFRMGDDDPKAGQGITTRLSGT
jgi:hypothetical protein